MGGIGPDAALHPEDRSERWAQRAARRWTRLRVYRRPFRLVALRLQDYVDGAEPSDQAHRGGVAQKVTSLQAAVDLHALGNALHPPPGPQKVEGIGQGVEVVALAGRHHVDINGLQRDTVEPGDVAAEDDVTDAVVVEHPTQLLELRVGVSGRRLDHARSAPRSQRPPSPPGPSSGGHSRS